MKIFDISMSIHEGMPVYKNLEKKKPAIRVVQDFSTASAFESRIDMDMHTGTHVDAPLHILPNGKTMDSLDLTRLVAPCKVVDLTRVEDHITRGDLESRGIGKGDFILLKTRNSDTKIFDPQYVFLDSTGAEYLQEAGINGVGIDALGIERGQSGHETHKVLLGAGIIILEGLRLKEVPEGEYLMAALPLKIQGAEAAPARVVLIHTEKG